MDCSACAIKVESALKRLPGVSNISMNYSTETLSVRLDENRTSQEVIENKIRALGYTPKALSGISSGASPLNDQERGEQPWWKTRSGAMAVSVAAAIAIAFAMSIVRPELSFWAYGAAALLGLVPVARRAAVGALSGTPFSIETLMTVAASGAIAIGAAEEAAVVLFLFAVGELLERVAAGRARAGINTLINLVPRTARIEEAGQIREVPVERLCLGEIAVVRPGDRVPSDGEVIEGQSEVDEAPVTGESVPVAKGVGDQVYAGSINANGALRLRLTHTATDNTIARIIHLVEEAQGSRAPTARFIDRFSATYTPAAMAVAALIIVGPPLFAGADWYTWIYRGLATLLIACPCALVISTPSAIASGLAAGARRGLLIKGGAALETLGKVKTIAFDKTGTLTVGKPKVTDIIAIEGTEDDVLAKAAAVERGSSHPLGVSITAAAEARGLAIPQSFGGSTAVPGKAVTARLKEGFVSVSSPRYAAEVGASAEVSARVEPLEAEGKTVVVILLSKRPIGLVALRDEPREDAASGLTCLNALGIRTVLLTGDNRRTGAAIGRALGLEVQSELLPEAKLAAINDLKKTGPVAMIGDGINDAPALATADVGVAMGSGTDVALETAEAALLKNRVLGVAELVMLSRATLANIWQNITIALGLKAVFLISTVFGVTSLWMAILADTGATVLVTANALRLLRWR
ncbi:cadmium-translocating P-type ATPase [Bradyrhizobium hipponense]|uniref:P-type Zn(2+) transporter n=2 Tax=Bradyrhizobium hipponense TaxID=2605638 RepID=A0A5S4YR42_9BRAD|nr:cadmium-translocating P-type ATPase [Bradyrhizobium hipponense]